MDKLVSNISNGIGKLFNRKKLLLVGQHIDEYNTLIVNNISAMKELLTALTDGDIETCSDFQSRYKKVSRIIGNCMEYYEFIDDDVQYESFNSYKTTITALKRDYEDVYERVKPNSEFVNYSTDIEYNASVKYSEIANLSFAIMFGYNYLSIDVGYATTKSCPIMFRIPPLGIFLFPSGYADSSFWADASPTASGWWNKFFKTDNSGINSSTYIDNVRTNISYLLNNCKVYSVYDLNEACESFIMKADNYTNDSDFAKALYERIIECNSILNDFTLLERTQLLTYWSCKGICPKTIWFEMTYFPTYNHYNEFAVATAMALNVAITTLCSADNKTYFTVSYDTPSLSESTYDDPTTTSDSSNVIKVIHTSKGTATEQTISYTTTATSNPTKYITDVMFGTETKASGVSLTSYTASYDTVQSAFSAFIDTSTIDSTLENIGKDAVSLTNYKNFMSAIDYIIGDPNIKPLSNLTGSKIGFRVAITYEFLTKMLKTELNFPIVPFVGTNFINTWLMKNNKIDEECLPQKMFSKTETQTYKNDSISATDESLTVGLHSYPLNGKVMTTRILDESCLFQSDS